MKKITTTTGRLLLAAALLALASCTGDFEDINRNPNQVTEEQMEALNYKTGTKVRTLQSLVIPVQEHMYQFNESLTGGPFGGLYRRHGRHVADEVRDLQPLGRLAQVALRQCHHRNLHPL